MQRHPNATYAWDAFKQNKIQISITYLVTIPEGLVAIALLSISYNV